MNHELAAFDQALAAKPQLVVATKLDVTEATERLDATRAAFAARGIDLLAISAVTGDGMPALLARVATAVRAARAATRSGRRGVAGRVGGDIVSDRHRDHKRAIVGAPAVWS